MGSMFLLSLCNSSLPFKYLFELLDSQFYLFLKFFTTFVYIACGYRIHACCTNHVSHLTKISQNYKSIYSDWQVIPSSISSTLSSFKSSFKSDCSPQFNTQDLEREFGFLRPSQSAVYWKLKELCPMPGIRTFRLVSYFLHSKIQFSLRNINEGLIQHLGNGRIKIRQRLE